MSDEQNITEEFEVVQAGAIEQISRAEIDQQIATAKRYPRPPADKIRAEIIKAAAESPETAKECFYALERRDSQSGKINYILGPSARMAEVVVALYGNIHTAARIVNIDKVNRMITAQAVTWDLEKNVRRAIEYTQRILMRGDDGVKIAALAAISLADRNAALKVVPRIIWWPAFVRCMQVADGDLDPFQIQVEKMLAYWKNNGVEEGRILAKFGLKDAKEITPEIIVVLRGFATTIREGEHTPETLFPSAFTTPPASQTEQVQGNNFKALQTIPEAEPSRGVSAESPSEPSGKRPRGRPPGSGKRQAPSTVASDSSSDITETSSEGGTEEAKAQEEPSVEHKAEEADTKAPIVSALRDKMKARNISEPQMLAQFKAWNMDRFAIPGVEQPAALEDYQEQTLKQILERWENLVTHMQQPV